MTFLINELCLVIKMLRPSKWIRKVGLIYHPIYPILDRRLKIYSDGFKSLDLT